MRFSDEMIRAIVEIGRIDDPAAEEHMIRTLIERRDKIVRYYLARINPVDGFSVSTGSNGQRRLTFVNLGVEAGLATDCSYGYSWHTFGNETGYTNRRETPVSPSALRSRSPTSPTTF